MKYFYYIIIMVLLFSIILNLYMYNLYNINNSKLYETQIENKESINIKLGISQKILQEGVFPTKDFKKNELIERCPCLILNKKQIKNIRTELQNTILYNYWWETNDSFLIAIGYAACINHDRNPNSELQH